MVDAELITKNIDLRGAKKKKSFFLILGNKIHYTNMHLDFFVIPRNFVCLCRRPALNQKKRRMNVIIMLLQFLVIVLEVMISFKLQVTKTSTTFFTGTFRNKFATSSHQPGQVQNLCETTCVSDQS